ncbi:MAG: sodium-dependent transporter, partial [Clostridia bacterium]
TAIGRKTASAPIKAYKTLDKRFKIIGVLGILSSFIIMSYYSVIGGWVLKYVFSYVFTQNAPNNFNEYIASPIEPLIWFLVFILCAFVICLKGTKGIEKATKFMMPALLIMLIIIVIRSLTLGGSVEGLKFIFLPESGFTMSSISAALGQVFYSLSLCMGITITYGSYLSKKDNIVKSTNVVAWLDSFVAILAGLAIFPAVFSFGLEPSQGPGLTFGTLPNVFSSFSGGWIFAIIFFLLMFFAAVSSVIGSLECLCMTLFDSFKIKRKTALIIIVSLVFVCGIPASLSFGILGDFKILNMTIFDFMTMITDNILMPIGGILLCIFIGWVIKPEFIIKEVEENNIKFKLKKLWIFCIKYLSPVLVSIVTIVGIFNVFNLINS